MKFQYQDITFRKKALVLIDQAENIIDEYQAQGYDLTLRQLYYKFVARDLFPEDRRWSLVKGKWVKDPKGTKNAPPNYKWLGGYVNDGRLGGLLDWEFIVDRIRKLEEKSHWSSPSHIIQSCAEYYGIDTRYDQDHYVEVWVEKDALSGVIKQACGPLDVSWFACKGYFSQPAMWRAGRRIKKIHNEHRIILHLGDHDPSGIDMTRDIQDRLTMFEADVTVKRIALNMDQIEELNPPSDPAKVTDSRYDDYRDKYGDESWELDALEPKYLVDLITDNIAVYTNDDRRNRLVNRQQKQRDQLLAVSNNWDDIVDEYADEE